MSTQILQSGITFGQLFKFFRIQAGFATIAQFADALADLNIIYCESLYYHWQGNSKIPNNRKLVLQVISVFINCGAIITYDQVNMILESAGKGYLTNLELTQLPRLNNDATDQQISDFKSKLQLFIQLEGFKKNSPKEYKKRIPKIVRFNCMLEEETNSFLKIVAKKNNTTKSNFIRQLIEEHKKNELRGVSIHNS